MSCTAWEVFSGCFSAGKLTAIGDYALKLSEVILERSRHGASQRTVRPSQPFSNPANLLR